MRYIFIDCGSHKGEHLCWFLRSECYFAFNWEIFAFEPNPVLASIFTRLDFISVDFFDKAVWIDDCEQDYYIGKNSVSSTLVKGKRTGGLKKVLPVRVKCIDIDKWIRKNFKKSDFIVISLDVEGAEYAVLEHMLKKGSAEYLNSLYVEFHNWKVNIPVERDKVLMKSLQDLGVFVKSGGRFSVFLKELKDYAFNKN